MPSLDDDRATPLTSEPIAFVLSTAGVFGDIPMSLAQLKRNVAPRAITDEERTELIKSVRAGAHVELEVPAVTYVQKDGAPNRNGLRFKKNQLGKIARSFKGKPALVDHRSWMQSARIGTIASSDLVTDDDEQTSFHMTLRVVKPDAVISVLDGTLDRFSIGWAATGPITCSVHRTPVFESCSCWPLDTVTIDEESKVVEYEFSSAEGDEVSGVNTPAVSGTGIQDVRLALAAAIAPFTKGHKSMSFPKLATALGVPGLAVASDEDRAISVVAELSNRATAAETQLSLYKDRTLTAERALGEAQQKITELSAAKIDAEVDALIDHAYASGRLKIERDDKGARVRTTLEIQLRKSAKLGGIENFREYIEGMPQIIPINSQPAIEAHPDRQERATSGVAAKELESVARQLGLDVAAVNSNAAQLAATRSGVYGARSVVASGLDHPLNEER